MMANTEIAGSFRDPSEFLFYREVLTNIIPSMLDITNLGPNIKWRSMGRVSLLE